MHFSKIISLESQKMLTSEFFGKKGRDMFFHLHTEKETHYFMKDYIVNVNMTTIFGVF